MSDLDITVDSWTEGPLTHTRVAPGSDPAADTYFRMCLPFHEAAHAVVALHFGIPVRYVTIRKAEAVESLGDPNGAGLTMMGPHAGPVFPQACVAFAGIANDSTFGFPGCRLVGSPSAALAAAASHARRDFEECAALAPSPAAQRKVSRRTYEVLLAYRADVVAVGRALQERGRLTGEEVMALLAPSR
jgi:hypothetical protein